MRVCIDVHVCIHTRDMYIYIDTYIYTYIYIYMYLCVYVYKCTCLHIYTTHIHSPCTWLGLNLSSNLHLTKSTFTITRCTWVQEEAKKMVRVYLCAFVCVSGFSRVLHVYESLDHYAWVLKSVHTHPEIITCESFYHYNHYLCIEM